MNIEYLFKDRPVSDPMSAAVDPSPIIFGKRGKLHALLNGIADGEKHPAVLILHGFPGTEKNLDMAQALRRVGFNVFTFNYSGAWGSAGDFSFANCMEDCLTLIDHIKTSDDIEGCLIDHEKLFVVGHSMGGFMTLRTLAAADGITAGCCLAPYDFGLQAVTARYDKDAEENLALLLPEADLWLHGTDASKLLRELTEKADEYAVTAIAEKLADVPLKIIAAEYDSVAVTEKQSKVIYNEIKKIGRGNVSYISLPTEHSFSNMRCELCRLVAEWLISNM